MQQVIRIGTRNSELALWQTNLVASLLQNLGYTIQLIEVKSEGDLNLTTPLYAMNVQGIFTKALDIALLNNRIDLAVHSMKDVPTQMALGLAEMAVLVRARHQDLLVYKNDLNFLNTAGKVIASSSIRRRAQWLNRYPDHRFTNIRGNVNTRLQKLQDNDWSGAIFAAAGLERINKKPAQSLVLDWMLPAPAQGAILVAGREKDHWLKEACASLHHPPTAMAVHEERTFLSRLMGGCTAPIGAYARIEKEAFFFEGNVLSTDGTQKRSVSIEVALREATGTGWRAAGELLQQGAADIIKEACGRR